MAVTIEMQNTGDSRARREILVSVEHLLSDVAGEWRVPAGLPLAILETDEGMEILSQGQEQNQAREPDRRTIRGDQAESGQLLLIINVEAFDWQTGGPSR